MHGVVPLFPFVMPSRPNDQTACKKKEMNACFIYLGGFETLGGCEGLYGGWGVGDWGGGGSCHVL